MRTVIATPFLLLLSLWHTQVSAFSWDDLFATNDQQGAVLLKQNHPFKAAKTFENSEWRGVAYYRSGSYQNALAEFSQKDDELNLFNRSLAYARLGEFDLAINTIDQLLKKNPNNQKAKDNRAVFEAMKKKQKRTSSTQQENKSEMENKKRSRLSEQPQKGPGPKAEDQKAPDELNEGKNKRPSPGSQSKQDQQQNPNNPNDNDNDDADDSAPKPQPSLADQEHEQAKQQWLKRIPDDPGGLLREKFLRDYQRRQQNRG